MEDYSSWCNKEVAPKYFKGISLEIVSVFVDYDDNNRITFNLLNGEKVVQPKPDRAGVVVDNEEIRVWNIAKAHWQSLLSVWPSLIHTWVHFHFNDLVCSLTNCQIICHFTI